VRLILSNVQELFTGRAERVLFVHAHPDDETIVTGGTIAMLTDAGAAVTVLTCTRGERGEVIPEEFKHLEGAGEQLADFRTAELVRAMHVLGVEDHRFLGANGARSAQREPRRYTDSGMQWSGSKAVPLDTVDADSLCAADPGEVAQDVAAVIADAAIDAVVSYDETGGYGHPDHIAAHRAAKRAAETMGVPFFAIEPATSRSSSAFDVDISAMRERKIAALHEYPSQITVTDDTFALSSGPFRRVPGIESFRRVRADQPALWNDQAVSGKITGAVLALLTGLAVGALATVNHQVGVIWFGVPVPVGVLVALGLVAALLVGLRLMFGSRALSGLAAVGILISIGALSLMSAGGSVLVPANAVGWTWTFGAPVIAAAVLGWPRLSRHRGQVSDASRRHAPHPEVVLGTSQHPKGNDPS
jgi:N-acetyl-1-D-myo-inositol-2-amino-2-deoxy-alpha-D-glucopyranoside deacetylase